MTKRIKCRYFYNCTDIPEKYVRDMEYMIDSSKKIAWAAFTVKVRTKDIKQIFPEYFWRGNKDKAVWDLHIKDDWSVSFHSSTFRGYGCYYIVHSAIEYIWIRTDYRRSAYSKRRWPEPIEWSN